MVKAAQIGLGRGLRPALRAARRSVQPRLRLRRDRRWPASRMACIRALTPVDSLRSLAGSVAPFAFSFSALSLAWARAIIRDGALDPAADRRRRARCWMRLASGRCSSTWAARGWAALGHPAFLGGLLPDGDLCLPDRAVPRRASAARWRCWRPTSWCCATTGARAPLVYAVVGVPAGRCCSSRAPAFPWRRRLTLLLGGRGRTAGAGGAGRRTGRAAAVQRAVEPGRATCRAARCSGRCSRSRGRARPGSAGASAPAMP